MSKEDAVVLQYHIHWLKFVPLPEVRDERPWSSNLGIVLDRQTTVFTGPKEFISLREQVLSVSVAQPVSRFSPYYIAILSDGKRDDHDFVDRATWQSYGLSPCTKGTGILQFIAILRRSVRQWQEGWKSTLDNIDRVVGVTLREIGDEEIWQDLMFDTSFKLSKSYFQILQVLRIIDEWVEQSVWDLRRFSEQWISKSRAGRDYSQLELDSLRKDFEKLVADMGASAQQIQERAHRKTEEIKSLRDGLFNATSLREATRGMAMNRAIYVFTIVTVLYTPVGFLATFWALPFLNQPGHDGTVQEPKAFRNTFIIIPLLTYVLCVAAAWYFGSKTAGKLTSEAKTAWRLLRAYFSRMRNKIKAGSRGGEE
ncbi:hypothetical protein VTK73DRAFT_2828 [Phialemonium thermophilum]|uniref:Uncharacterized protein n=1 Tax=Phialemonium thermophilum TaxID=223376 RepID=A0ABR3X320_9PEZI